MNIATMNLDAMMKDIIEIFNTEGVKLVRLSGLFLRERRISNYTDLKPDELDNIIHKLKANKLINYEFIVYCPHCQELTYQVEHKENPYSARICDTCSQMFIPARDISLYELEEK